MHSLSSTYFLAGVATLDPIANLYLSSVDVGTVVKVECLVKTCLPDIDVQFFAESELMNSSTSKVDSGWEGILLIEVGVDLDGEYVCQAMNEDYNMVLRTSFKVTGKYYIENCKVNV